MNSRDRLALWVFGLLAVGGIALGSLWVARGCREYREVEARVEEFEARVESYLPKGRGIAATPRPQESTADVLITLERVRKPVESGKYVAIRLGARSWEVRYPDDDAPDSEWETRGAVIDSTLDEIAEAIAAIRKARTDRDTIVGGIRTAGPYGTDVPHGLVVRVLDCFIRAGINDVQFGSAPLPAPSHESEER